MKIKFRRFERVDRPGPIGKFDLNDYPPRNELKVQDYEFDSEKEAIEWIQKQIELFIQTHNVRDPSTDKSFLRYKSELLDDLASQVAREKKEC